MPYSVFPTGTTIYEPEKAYNCYVLHEGRDGRSYLIDMNGNTVHSWPYTGFPKDIVWQYDASCSGKPFWTFFSSFISSARRLPNGNTLICEGMNGRLFQVTSDGDIVWEYVNPYFGQWADHNVESGGNLSNWVFRAQPIPYDWVPDETPRREDVVTPPDNSKFRIKDI